jgi:hypothetical protein
MVETISFWLICIMPKPDPLSRASKRKISPANLPGLAARRRSPPARRATHRAIQCLKPARRTRPTAGLPGCQGKLLSQPARLFRHRAKLCKKTVTLLAHTVELLRNTVPKLLTLMNSTLIAADLVKARPARRSTAPSRCQAKAGWGGTRKAHPNRLPAHSGGKVSVIPLPNFSTHQQPHDQGQSHRHKRKQERIATGRPDHLA